MDDNNLLMIILAFVVGYMIQGMMNNMCGSILIEGKGRWRPTTTKPSGTPGGTNHGINLTPNGNHGERIDPLATPNGNHGERIDPTGTNDGVINKGDMSSIPTREQASCMLDCNQEYWDEQDRNVREGITMGEHNDSISFFDQCNNECTNLIY